MHQRAFGMYLLAIAVITSNFAGFEAYESNLKAGSNIGSSPLDNGSKHLSSVDRIDERTTKEVNNIKEWKKSPNYLVRNKLNPHIPSELWNTNSGQQISDVRITMNKDETHSADVQNSFLKQNLKENSEPLGITYFPSRQKYSTRTLGSFLPLPLHIKQKENDTFCNEHTKTCYNQQKNNESTLLGLRATSSNFHKQQQLSENTQRNKYGISYKFAQKDGIGLSEAPGFYASSNTVPVVSNGTRHPMVKGSPADVQHFGKQPPVEHAHLPFGRYVLHGLPGKKFDEENLQPGIDKLPVYHHTSPGLHFYKKTGRVPEHLGIFHRSIPFGSLGAITSEDSFESKLEDDGISSRDTLSYTSKLPSQNKFSNSSKDFDDYYISDSSSDSNSDEYSKAQIAPSPSYYKSENHKIPDENSSKNKSDVRVDDTQLRTNEQFSDKIPNENLSFRFVELPSKHNHTKDKVIKDILAHFKKITSEHEHKIKGIQDKHFQSYNNEHTSVNMDVTPVGDILATFTQHFSDDFKDKNDTVKDDQLPSERIFKNDDEHQNILTLLQKYEDDGDAQPHSSKAAGRMMKNKYDEVSDRYNLKAAALQPAKGLDVSTQMSAGRPLIYSRSGHNLDKLPSEHKLKDDDDEYQKILTLLQKYKDDGDTQILPSEVAVTMMKNKFDEVSDRNNLKPAALQSMKGLDLSTQLSPKHLPMYSRTKESSNLDQIPYERIFKNGGEHEDILTLLQKYKGDGDAQPHSSKDAARMMKNKYDEVSDRYNLKPGALQPAKGLDVSTQISAKRSLMYGRSGQSSNLDKLPSEHKLKDDDEHQKFLTLLQKYKDDGDAQPHSSKAAARIMKNKYDEVSDRYNLKPGALQPAKSLNLSTQMSAKRSLMYGRGGRSLNLDTVKDEQLPFERIFKNGGEHQDVFKLLQKYKGDGNPQPYFSGTTARMMKNKSDEVQDRYSLKPASLQPVKGLDPSTQMSAGQPLMHGKGGPSSNQYGEEMRTASCCPRRKSWFRRPGVHHITAPDDAE